MSLSPENEAMLTEMETLAWQLIREADPDWAQQHLTEFEALGLDDVVFARVELLEQKRAMEYEVLQAQGLVPDFFCLRNQARINLGLSPIDV